MKREYLGLYILFGVVLILALIAYQYEEKKDKERRTKIFWLENKKSTNLVKMAELIRASQLNDGVIDTAALTAVRNVEDAIIQMDSLKTEKEMNQGGSINYEYWKHYIPTEIK